MYKHVLAATFALSSFAALAQDISVATNVTLSAEAAAHERFCSERVVDEHALQRFLRNSDNRLAFTNGGGLMGGGVCWWHSRFTRNAAYLVQFRPDLPAETDAKAIKRMVTDIRKGKKVVVVPGFRNLREFSTAYIDEIQSKLEGWQKHDGFIEQAWITGLSGSTEVTAEDLGKKMDDLYALVGEGDVVYQRLQLPGIASHAWLVVDMEKTAGGYKIYIIDSNTYSIDTYEYRQGDTSFSYWGDNFVPYTGKTKEEQRLQKILNKSCKDFIEKRDAARAASNSVLPH